ncbi:protein translocase subunit SecD [Alteromonadales bacterium alter-6D02]|nr:protein translocase subunit SecD [Alteromonadales bacterium alter-6D02]
MRKKPLQFKWQQLLSVIVLLFLMVSALPNIYQEQLTISLTAKERLTFTDDTNDKMTVPRLKSLLTSQGISVSQANATGNNIAITLADKADEAHAMAILNQQLEQHFFIASSLTSSMPSWLKSTGAAPIKLGLDLSGGVLFVLDVDVEQGIVEQFKGMSHELKSIIRTNNLRGAKVVQPKPTQLQVIGTRLSSEQQSLLIAEFNRAYPDVTAHKKANKITFNYSPQQYELFHQQTMDLALKTMRGRIEELGITEAVTQKQGRHHIRIELPGVHDPAQAKRIIGATASLDFYQFANNDSTGVFRINDSSGQMLHLNPKSIFSGSNIKSARAGQDEMGLPLVNLVLDSIGGRKMTEFSRDNVGKPMATIFSEYYRDANDQMLKKQKVINVANIQQVLGSQFSITNMSSAEAAQDLALLLRAGSLPAPVTIVMQRTIEASLGADNINNGVKALILGITFTLIFMGLCYRRLGLVANVALGCNLVSLLGLMSLLPGAVLTLPGIAGLVLTVGMAVDTNVLIFERIKEEIKRGRSTLQAVEMGYQNALGPILDANLTTLITGIILYAIGYGPVKGFALILCLGILTSMFTGVFVSKVLTNLVIRQNKTRLFGAAS